MPEADAPTSPHGFPRAGQAFFAGDLDGTSGGTGPVRGDVPAEDLTPPTGIPAVVGPDGVVGAETVVEEADFGQAAPAVLGAPDPAATDPAVTGAADNDPADSASHDEAGDWPKLEYRSRGRSRSSGALGWIRRRRDAE